MFRKCSGIAVLTSMVSSHPEICKTGMHPKRRIFEKVWLPDYDLGTTESDSSFKWIKSSLEVA